MLGCEDFCIWEASHSQKTGMASHRATLPTAIATTSAARVSHCEGVRVFMVAFDSTRDPSGATVMPVE